MSTEPQKVAIEIRHRRRQRINHPTKQPNLSLYFRVLELPARSAIKRYASSGLPSGIRGIKRQ